MQIHFVDDKLKQSVMSATDPNRLYWIFGSTGIPGGPQTPDEAGPVLQNVENAQG
jgi:phospholipase C